MREGLLEAGGGGGGAGRLGRAAPARGVLGGSGRTAARGPSGGLRGLLPAFAVLFGGAMVFGATARTPGSCPGLPAEKEISDVIHQDFVLSHLTKKKQNKTEKVTLQLPLPSGHSE